MQLNRAYSYRPNRILWGCVGVFTIVILIQFFRFIQSRFPANQTFLEYFWNANSALALEMLILSLIVLEFWSRPLFGLKCIEISEKGIKNFYGLFSRSFISWEDIGKVIIFKLDDNELLVINSLAKNKKIQIPLRDLREKLVPQELFSSYQIDYASRQSNKKINTLIRLVLVPLLLLIFGLALLNP